MSHPPRTPTSVTSENQFDCSHSIRRSLSFLKFFAVRANAIYLSRREMPGFSIFVSSEDLRSRRSALLAWLGRFRFAFRDRDVELVIEPKKISVDLIVGHAGDLSSFDPAL